MIRRTGALALLIAAAACAPAAAAAVPVNVRVEGIDDTLFEGRWFADIRAVNSGDGTGKHKCDGTNGGASTKPGPTLLGAFDDVMKSIPISWKGKYSQDFQDFTIDKVGPDANDTDKGRFWGQALNFKDTQLGGCQIKLKKDDKVLVAFNSFGKPKLKLRGPKEATAGEPFRVTVLDGESGNRYEGAKVRGRTTGSKGRVKLVFENAGTYRFKARAKGAIRSNELRVKVGDGG